MHIKILKNLVMAVAGMGVAPTRAFTARRHFKTERMGLKIVTFQSVDAYGIVCFVEDIFRFQ